MRPHRMALLLTGALAFSSIATASPSSARPAHCLVPGEQRTIQVEVKLLDKAVKRGKVVRIEARTYRPAQKDFLGSGAELPPGTPMDPVGPVRLTVGVLSGNGYVYQGLFAMTNDKGYALVKVKLKPYHEPGKADVRVRAFIDHFSEQPANTCVELQECGITEVFDAFTIR